MASPTNTSACTLRCLALAAGVGEDLADLGVAAAAIDLLHQPAELARVRHPARGAAFGEPAVIDELHVEPADRRRLAEHVGLQPAGGVPHRLPAHGGVERKDQPAALAGLRRPGRATSPASRNASISARERGRRRLVAAARSARACGLSPSGPMGGSIRPISAPSRARRNGPTAARHGRSAGRVYDAMMSCSSSGLACGGEPFRAGRGAPHAALVDRQLQRREQRLDLLPGGHMRHARAACRASSSSRSSSAVRPRG